MTSVRLLYNLREDHPDWGEPNPTDSWADWDILPTIELLMGGLQRIGFDVEPVRVRYPIDVAGLLTDDPVVSICEMLGGAYREAIIPAICEAAGITYIFSEPDVMVKTLDKDVCNHLVRALGVEVPDWTIVSGRGSREVIARFHDYPYIVKPRHEGSGMGITDASVVHTPMELVEQLSKPWTQHRRPMMVQRYIEGREVTIGVTGYGSGAKALTPIEMDLRGRLVYGFDAKESQEAQIEVSSLAPADVREHVQTIAQRIHVGLDCRDASRLDFRVTEDGVVHFIEINPLPHLHPDLGDFCKSAYVSGLNYDDLLKLVCSRLMDGSPEGES